MKNKLDLTGNRYGRLTVIRKVEQSKNNRSHWLCQCDCGREIIVAGGHLRSGHTKSCGCYRRELPKDKRTDITGRRFGRLVAIEPIETVRGTKWKCQCDCGNYTIAARENLIAGNTKSCGCLQDEVRKDNMKKSIHFVDGTCVERIASRKNCANNTSGCRGVYKRKNNTWRASIGFKGKVYNLGTFVKFEDAVKARKEAEAHLYDEFLKGIEYGKNKERVSKK